MILNLWTTILKFLILNSWSLVSILYSDASYFAMLFAAGIGVGMYYYGVAETIMHYEPNNFFKNSKTSYGNRHWKKWVWFVCKIFFSLTLKLPAMYCSNLRPVSLTLLKVSFTGTSKFTRRELHCFKCWVTKRFARKIDVKDVSWFFLKSLLLSGELTTSALRTLWRSRYSTGESTDGLAT